MLAQHANLLNSVIKVKLSDFKGLPSYHFVYKMLGVTVNTSQVVAVGKDAEYSVFFTRGWGLFDVVFPAADT